MKQWQAVAFPTLAMGGFLFLYPVTAHAGTTSFSTTSSIVVQNPHQPTDALVVQNPKTVQNLVTRESVYAQLSTIVSTESIQSKLPTNDVVALAKSFRAYETKEAKIEKSKLKEQQAKQAEQDFTSRFDPSNHSYFTGQKAYSSVEYFMPIIRHYANQYGVSSNLVAAIMLSETGGNPYAISRTGAVGLMQLEPYTFAQYSAHDLFHPELNIKLGTEYLASLSARYSGNVSLIAAAYNAGPDAVSKYGGVPPYHETMNYVSSVNAHLATF